MPSSINVVQAASHTFAPAVKKSAFVKANLSDPDYMARYNQIVADAMTMTKGQLQNLYKTEYTSLRSRRQQAKSRHIKFDHSLKDLRDWLIHLGPRPAKNWTVDRINRSKGYQPSNLRWATKLQQTHNRNVTRWHKMPCGDLLSTKQLAIKLGFSYTALYKRLHNGWTVERLLQQEKPLGLESWKFPSALSKHCETLYRQRKYYKQHRIDWFIEYLDDVFYNKLAGTWGKPGNTIPSIMEFRNQARADRTNILQQQKEREAQSLQELLIILDPLAPLTLIQSQSGETDEEPERFLNEYQHRL